MGYSLLKIENYKLKIENCQKGRFYIFIRKPFFRYGLIVEKQIKWSILYVFNLFENELIEFFELLNIEFFEFAVQYLLKD